MAIDGLVKAKSRLGNPKVEWASLILPSVHMCRSGVVVSRRLARDLQKFSMDIKNSEWLSRMFLDASTGEVLSEGQKYRCERLAETMERIAVNSNEEMSEGLTRDRVAWEMMADKGGMTKQDLSSARY